MYRRNLHDHISAAAREANLSVANKDNAFYTRFLANASDIAELFDQLYAHHPAHSAAMDQLVQVILDAYIHRGPALRERDQQKGDQWYLSNQIAGMSLYVDRFCGSLRQLPGKLPYLQELGVNFLHLMPLFQSPPGESDGGYAVSDFRKVDARFGTLDDLTRLQQQMQERNMYLMLDIVLNHTSHHHLWAQKARAGDPYYSDFYYFYPDRNLPDRFDETMPEIFPEVAPGNFTYVTERREWVMTVFHNYQWDLNYANPYVLVEMMDTIFFYANLGLDILRIDAPAFIWKQLGTTCQNLPQAHTLLRLIKLCTQVATPGLALLGEAIVAPSQIMKYFGTGRFTSYECDFAYNATQMALQWDALATGKTKVMMAAQAILSEKPFGTSWINYTRCHDDIGLGYDDYMIEQAGYNPYEHRRYLKNYYTGNSWESPARGALFAVNLRTQDARISGTLASLCGLETAVEKNDTAAINLSIQKILMMQAHSFFLGGVPMIFYGDEAGYTNDYTYMQDPAKKYDNRWMHRPVIDWEKNALANQKGTIEHSIYTMTKKLLSIRKKLDVVADKKNLTWLTPHNIHVIGYLRAWDHDRLYCIFNFSNQQCHLTWHAFREHGMRPALLYDHWEEKTHTVGADHEHLLLQPYQFCLLEPR